MDNKLKQAYCIWKNYNSFSFSFSHPIKWVCQINVYRVLNFENALDVLLSVTRADNNVVLGKSDEGGYYRTYGSDAEGEKGYLKEIYGKGDHGYKTLDTFHKQDGDKYEFETQTTYGKAHADDKKQHNNEEKSRDHEGAGKESSKFINQRQITRRSEKNIKKNLLIDKILIRIALFILAKNNVAKLLRLSLNEYRIKLFLIKFNQSIKWHKNVKALRNINANKVKIFFINIT